MARVVARGSGGGVPALLRRVQREGDVRNPGAAPPDDGARTSHAEGNLLQSGNL